MSCEDISNRTNTLRAEANQADEELSRMEDLLEELGEWLEENAEKPDIEDDVYEEKSEQYY